MFLRLQRESKVGVVFLCACLSCAFSSVEGGKRIKGAESFFSIVFVLLVHALFILLTCLCVLDEPIHKAAKKKR